MNEQFRRTAVTPPSSISSIPNDNQVDELKDVNHQALREAISQIVYNSLSDRDLGQHNSSTADLVVKYNSRVIPIMPDEVFVAKVDHFRESDMSDEKIESEVQRFMDEENTRVYKAYEDTVLEHGIDLISLPTDGDKGHCLMNSIRSVTVHGHQALVAICVPMLLETTCQLKNALERMSNERSEASPKKNLGARRKQSSGAVSKWSSNRVSKTGSKVLKGASKSKGTSLDKRRSTYTRDVEPSGSQRHSYDLRRRPFNPK